MLSKKYDNGASPVFGIALSITTATIVVIFGAAIFYVLFSIL